MHHIEHGLSPKEATIKAMEEVSSPVIAIALILAAVFIPVAFTPGITGRLYQQFAITIAISVLFSAFNALTLSPALSVLLLKPAGAKKGLLDKFFTLFNRVFNSITNGYVGVASMLARKLIRSLILIGIIVGVIMMLGRRIPGGFVPDEDQGYFMVNVQLPDAASLERTDQICKKVESILAEEKAIESYNTITGFSLLTQSYASNTGFFFISLKPWEERKKSEVSFEVMRSLKPEIRKSNSRRERFLPSPSVHPGTRNFRRI